MQKFVYEYATKVYFGEGAAKEHLAAAVSAYGPHVMLAYGGGSVKKNGIYDEVKSILKGGGQRGNRFFRHHVQSYLRQSAGRSAACKEGTH